MHARTTTVNAAPENYDAGVGHVRDAALPTVRTLHGALGLSLLGDRATGRAIMTTAWADQEALQGAHRTDEARHLDIAAAFDGTAEIDDWEIALVHRRHDAHHGACARVTWSRTEPGRMDDGIDILRTAVLQQMAVRLGFCSASLLVDRESGRSALTVAYDSPQDMAAATEEAHALRAEVMPGIGTEVVEVAEFDLVLAHLRVPDTE